MRTLRRGLQMPGLSIQPAAKSAGARRGKRDETAFAQYPFLSKIQLFCAGIIAYNAAHERACFSA